MSGRYFFLVNEPLGEDLPIPEIAMNDASGKPVDVWHFFRGETYRGEPVPVCNMPTDRVYHVLFDAFLVPFVSETLGGLIRDAAGDDVQLVPTTHPDYCILNVLRVHDAIDRNRSRYSRFPADEPRADLAGKPTMLRILVMSRAIPASSRSGGHSSSVEPPRDRRRTYARWSS